MENYLKKIQDLVEELKKVPNISNLVFEKNTGIREEDFVDYANEFSIKISKEVKELYSQFDGFILKWKYTLNDSKSKNISFEGDIEIFPFYKMFLGYNDNLWENEIWGNHTPDKDITFYKNLKIFDYFEKDNVHCICIEISNNTLTQNLWIFREGYEPIPMTINITEYIDKLIYTKGFWGWQYLYTNVNLSLDKHKGIFDGIKESIELWSKLLSSESLIEIKKDLGIN